MSKFDPTPYLIKLQGRDYLPVAYRVVWFRADHPTGSIDTEAVSTDPLLFKATVYDGDGKRLATGHAGADAGGRKVVWGGREFEKAETAAIGRALAHAGYGTQFTGEIEGEYLADSPVQPPTLPARAKKQPNGRANRPPEPDPLVQAAGELGGKLAEARKGWHADAALIAALRQMYPDQPPNVVINRLKKMQEEGAIVLADLSEVVIGAYQTRMEEKHGVKPMALEPAA